MGVNVSDMSLRDCVDMLFGKQLMFAYVMDVIGGMLSGSKKRTAKTSSTSSTASVDSKGAEDGSSTVRNAMGSLGLNLNSMGTLSANKNLNPLFNADTTSDPTL